MAASEQSILSLVRGLSFPRKRESRHDLIGDLDYVASAQNRAWHVLRLALGGLLMTAALIGVGVWDARRTWLTNQSDVAQPAETPSTAAPVTTAGRSFPDYQRARRQVLERELACGPLSLFAVLETLGVEVPPETRQSAVDRALVQGSTMRELKDMAEELGVHAAGVQISAGELQRIEMPAVALFDTSVFVAVLGYPEDGFELQYAGREPAVVTREAFTKHFGETGRALLLSPSRIESRLRSPAKEVLSGPLVLSQEAVALGVLPSRRWSREVVVTNQSDLEVVISAVASSCSCMEARLDSDRLAPGQSARLAISGVEEREGVFRHEVKLATEDGTLIRLPVSGYVDPPVYFNPPAVTIGGVLVGKTATIKIPVHVLESVDASSLRVQVPPNAPLRIEPPAGTAEPNLLELDFHGLQEPGWYSYEIQVGVPSQSTDGQADAPQPDVANAKLLLTVEVGPHLEVFPESVWLRDDELGTTWTRTIRVRSQREDGFSLGGVSWSDERFHQVIDVKVTPSSPTEIVLHLMPKDAAILPELSGETATLSLEGDRSDGVSIPVRIAGSTSFFEAARSAADLHDSPR